MWSRCFCEVFFFNDTATTEIDTYLHTLSLPVALPISAPARPLPSASLSGATGRLSDLGLACRGQTLPSLAGVRTAPAQMLELAEVMQRSEAHTSELQSLMRF